MVRVVVRVRVAPVCEAPAPARVNHKGADVGGGAGASVGLRTGGVCCARLRSGISQATRWWVRVGAAGWPVRVQVQARVRQAGTHPWWVRRREWVRVRMRVQVWRRVCVCRLWGGGQSCGACCARPWALAALPAAAPAPEPGIGRGTRARGCSRRTRALHTRRHLHLACCARCRATGRGMGAGGGGRSASGR